MNIEKVAFIGLGVMGYPMAGYLKKNLLEVTVFNRTISKAEMWKSEYKGNFEKTVDRTVENCDAVFICVGRDEDLREVMEGPKGILANSKDGVIIIDHTTASADIAREYSSKCKKLNKYFLDAPISGGQAGAENGQLSIMVGGDKEAFTIIRPTLESYGKAIELIGDSGAGQLTKMINQICIAGLVQGLSEALAFGQKANLDMEKVLKVISKGAAQSWQMENRYRTMLDDKFDYGFAVDWMRKDLSYCFNEAKKNNSKIPITKIVDGYYQKVQENGGNRLDTSSLISLLK